MGASEELAFIITNAGLDLRDPRGIDIFVGYQGYGILKKDHSDSTEDDCATPELYRIIVRYNPWPGHWIDMIREVGIVDENPEDWPFRSRVQLSAWRGLMNRVAEMMDVINESQRTDLSECQVKTTISNLLNATLETEDANQACRSRKLRSPEETP